MKKILVSVLAIAGLVACNNENVVSELDSRTPITFDGVFVENATRANDPSTTTDNINEFYVWAYMNEVDGYVFNDETVSRSGDKWTYDNISYWMPDNHYFFAAFAGDRNYVKDLPTAMDAEGLGVITFTNNDGTNDILYAEYDVLAGTTNNPVKFQFAHLLSKVKFTFINGFANENQTIVVKDIQMVAPKVADIDLSADELAWANYSDEVTLDFGDMNGAAKLAIGDKKSSDNERLTIPAPATQSYTITFLVDVYNGERAGIENRLMTVELNGFEFVAGRAYNLVATINQENLNLDAIEFEVVVDEWIEQEVDGGAVEDEVRFVSTIGELQTILDAATGNTSVILGADLKGNVTVPELAGATIAINGNGHKFDGTFALVGGSTYGEGTTIFENIAFETAALNGYDAFIYCNEQNGNTRYPDNVTIKRCTFKGTDTAVAAKFRSLKGNLVVEDCQAEGIHSMLQLLSCGEANVLVDGVDVVDCGRGFSLENSTNVIRNTNVKAASYGVRLQGGAAATNIENSTIEATQPVIVRKLTTAGYTVNVDANTVLTTTGDYHVIFTKGSDDAAYVAPAVDFTFNGPADLVVFPEVVVVHNEVEMAAALTANAQKINVKMANDIDLPISSLGTITGGSGEYKLGGENTEAITIDLNEKTLNVTTTYWSNLGAKNNDALFTIKNGRMTSSQPTGTWNSYDLTFSNCDYAIEDVVFGKAIAFDNEGKSVSLKDVTINETHDYYAMWITAEGQNVTIDGLTVNSAAGRGIKIDEQYVGTPAKVTLNIADATFTTAKKAAILVKSVEGAEINVENINIANVAEDAEFAVWVDEDAAAYADQVVVNGAFVKVEGVDTVIAKNADDLKALLNDASVDTIVLGAGEFGVIVAKSNKTIIASADAKVDAVNLYGAENLTLKNFNFDAATAVVAVDGKGNSKQYANIVTGQNGANANKGARNLVIDGCTFTGTFANGGASIAFTDQNRGSGQSGDITIKNCVFNTENAYYSIYAHYSGYGSFVIENNTFNTEFAQGGTIYLGRYQSSTPVVVKGNAFNKDASLDEAMYIQAHSSAYNVSIAAENNTFAN